MSAEELTAWTLGIYIAVVIVAGALSLLFNSIKILAHYLRGAVRDLFDTLKWALFKLLRRKR